MRSRTGGFEDEVTAEREAVVAGEPACGHTCRDHGGYVCVRTVHDNYGDHWAAPDETAVIDATPIVVGRTADQPVFGYVFKPERRVPHAGYLDDGQLVTWSGPHLTDDEITALENAAAGTAHDRQAAAVAALALLTDLDLNELRARFGS